MTKKACEKWYSAFRSFPRFFEIFPSLVNQDTKDRLKKNKGKRRGKGERVVCIIADFQILLFEIIFPIRCLEKRKKKKIKREI